MSNRLFGHRSCAVLLLGTIIGVLPSGAQAQNQAVITGRVTSNQGQPLAGANVVVNSTNFGGSTDASGSYSITIGGTAAQTGRQVTLTARALGYKPVIRVVTLTLGTQAQNFTLAPDPLRLDELVVTGVSDATSSKKLTFAVGRVSEEQLQVAPGVSALGALQGKIAGVSLFEANGMPGTAPQIKLRGATSISGSQDPLILVDGIITRYSLSDISSEDIERVEVVKGAAASALYGSNAANGVIAIFTRRGKRIPEGKVQVTTRVEYGQSAVQGRPSLVSHHPFVLLPNGDFARVAGSNTRIFYGACDNKVIMVVQTPCPTNPDGSPNTVNIADKPYPSLSNTQDLLYDSGKFMTMYGAIGQNRGRTNFNISFQHTGQEGSVFNVKGMRRQNYRVNVDQVVSDKLDLSVNSFYARTDNEEPAGGGDGGPFFAIAFLEPHVDATECCNPDGTPYKARLTDVRSNASNPLYGLYTTHRDRVRSRFAGGGQLRYRPTSWLSVEGSFGFDELNSQFKQSQPRNYWTVAGPAAQGTLYRENEGNRSLNAGATVTGVWLLNKGSGEALNQNVGVTVKGAYLLEDQYERFFAASASKYIVDKVPEFTGTDLSGQRAASFEQSIRNKDFYGIGTLDLNGKIIMDGLYRRDGSSLFGPDARWATYYRASGALRIPQLLEWKDGPQEFRLRASYGTAGLRPGFEAQYEVLTPIGGTFVKTQLGNRNLRPAKSSEMELGFNLELAGGRFTTEYNYSNKSTKDQLILAPLLATTGFETQWQNVGTLQAKSHEVAVSWLPVNTRDLAVQLSLTGSRVREVITKWPLPKEAFGGGVSQWAGFVFTEGGRLGQMQGQKWVHSLDQLYLDPDKKAASGTGQAYDPAQYEVNYDGYLVLKANRGTNAERPIALVTCVDKNPANCGPGAATTNIHDLGVASPDFRIGFNATFSYKRFTATGLLDWSHGGQMYNATAHWGMQDCSPGICDQAAKPVGQRIAEDFYQSGLYNGANSNEAFVESASFLKLREVSVNYTFLQNQLNKVGLGHLMSEVRLGLIGRNLLRFDHYSGIDPEVAPGGQDAFKARSDFFSYPPFRTITAFIEIAF